MHVRGLAHAPHVCLFGWFLSLIFCAAWKTDAAGFKARQLVEGANSAPHVAARTVDDRATYTFKNRAAPVPSYKGYTPGARLPFREVRNPDLRNAIAGYRGHRPGTADGTLYSL